MKTLISIAFILIVSIIHAQESVRGYKKKNGTYVTPHKRSNKDKTDRNNWDTKPNYNPYTGKKGTKKAKK